jgi:hypothetical protein
VWQLISATALIVIVVVIASPGIVWWTSAALLAKIAMLAAIFALAGVAYLGALYCFGFRLSDVKR